MSSITTHEKPSASDLESGRHSREASTLNAPYGQPTATDYANVPMNNAAMGGSELNRTQTVMLPPWGGAFQPGPYKPSFRKFANPAPLGLCAFALTTFVLSLCNANTRGVHVPSIIVGAAYAYGGVIQLLAGMWEMAVGNTFGATALSSFGGFWIAWAMIETESLGLTAAYESPADLNNALGYFLLGWFIFTFLLVLCTLKSTVAFCSLFVFLDITFLLLAIAHLEHVDGVARAEVTRVAGIFGLITAFLAWWNALAGLLENSNSFFTLPVLRFPWSDEVRSEKAAKRNQ